MKNIAIFGTSRSGKSTLSRMISKKYPTYHIMGGDEIRSAFSDVLPGNNINSTGGVGMAEDFPRFVSSLFYKNIKRNKSHFNYIVETCDMTPQKAKELFSKEDTIIMFVGTPKQTVEFHFEQIRKHETLDDWTYKLTNDQILEHATHWLQKGVEFEKECKELGIWFVDTSFDRERVLRGVLEEIG